MSVTIECTAEGVRHPNCTPEEVAEETEKQIPRGLKSARDDKAKKKRLGRWPEGRL
jgi:hypothetical protein